MLTGEASIYDFTQVYIFCNQEKNNYGYFKS